MLCQAYQQNQCAGNSCSVGAHVCAMVVRDSGHVCGTKHPACKHRWDKKATEQRAGGSARETDADGAQLLAWMTTVNQQLNKSRLQWQSITLII